MQTSSKDEIKKAEIQFEICEPNVESLLEKLQLSESSTQTKQIFYYDSENLDLIRQNVAIKISPSESKSQSSVKIKDIDEDSIPWKLLKDQDSKCEEDIYLDLSRISCGINHSFTKTQNILSSAQFNLMQEMNIAIPAQDRLQSFGPVTTAEQSFAMKDYKLVIEASSVREHLATIELSVRVERHQALKIQNELVDLLNQAHVILCEDQQGKIKRLFKWLREAQ